VASARKPDRHRHAELDHRELAGRLPLPRHRHEPRRLRLADERRACGHGAALAAAVGDGAALALALARGAAPPSNEFGFGKVKKNTKKGTAKLTVIGIPIAIWKFVGWQFVQQEIVFADKPIREAFRGSSQVVSGRWWRTVRVAGFLWLLSIVVGPILTFALIFTTLSLVWINILGSIVFALLVPYVAIGRTLLYFDLEAREAEAATEPKRRRRWWSRLRPSAQPG
jgi:hypothetical protein